jgi:hypothetical protein
MFGDISDGEMLDVIFEVDLIERILKLFGAFAFGLKG